MLKSAQILFVIPYKFKQTTLYLLITKKEEKNMENKKIGVLLANLGTPDAPTTSDVKRYLTILERSSSDRSPQTKMANNLKLLRITKKIA